ncbi:MAG: hypothetical protein BGO32_03570 [Bacteroidetes bacterium 37-13]|nr:MAG: hypothetical protein BGO32_03570 [Bacteroidetes bacterium 37-13]
MTSQYLYSVAFLHIEKNIISFTTRLKLHLQLESSHKNSHSNYSKIKNEENKIYHYNIFPNNFTSRFVCTSIKR